jgi:hypothetical protein
MCRVPKSVTLFQECPGGDKLAEETKAQPVGAATPQLGCDIVPCDANFFNLLGK